MWTKNQRYTISLNSFEKDHWIVLRAKSEVRYEQKWFAVKLLKSDRKVFQTPYNWKVIRKNLGDALQSKSNRVEWNAVLNKVTINFGNKKSKTGIFHLKIRKICQKKTRISSKQIPFHCIWHICECVPVHQKMFTVIAFYWCEKFIELKSVFKKENAQTLRKLSSKCCSLKEENFFRKRKVQWIWIFCQKNSNAH